MAALSWASRLFAEETAGAAMIEFELMWHVVIVVAASDGTYPLPSGDFDFLVGRCSRGSCCWYGTMQGKGATIDPFLFRDFRT